MLRPTLVTLLLAPTALVEAHFHFIRLAHNGIWQAPTRYIRNITEPFYEPFNPDKNDERPNRGISDPVYYADAPNSVRCGRGNMDHAAVTEVLKVKAGDTLEFAASNLGIIAERDDSRYWDCPDGRGFCTYHTSGSPVQYPMFIQHAGPVSLYLSAPPSGIDIDAYDGSGEWTKIHTFGVQIRKDMEKPFWLPNNNTDENFGTGTRNPPVRMPFKIPEQTPAGTYLLRVDMVFNYWQTVAQLYPSCAQIIVEGSATGALPGTVKIPEAFYPDMPGMTTTWQHGYGLLVDGNYTYPGGDLWTGEKMVIDRPDLTPV